MNLNTVSAGGTSINIARVLSPSFRGIPDATALAKYLIRTLVFIKKNNLPIKIYLTQDVTAKIGNILTALGVKFKTIPASRMEPPYILLSAEDNYIVIKTVDSSGREIASYKAPLSKFIEAFELLSSSYRKKSKQKEKSSEPQLVDEIIVSAESLEKFLERYRDILEEEDSS